MKDRPALRITLVYALFSGLWILLSDRILSLLVTQVDQVSWLQTYKGLAFVMASAGLIFFLLQRDLAVRTRVEHSLRSSEERYRALVEQASDGIFVTDLNGAFLSMNPTGCRMLGYSLPEVLRKNFLDLIPSEDLAGVPGYLDELNAGRTILAEGRLRCADGGLLLVEISASKLADGRLQGIMRDISQRKQAERALQFLGDIFEYTQMGVAIGGPDGQSISMVNPAFARMHGYSQDELIDRPVSALIPPDFQADQVEHIRLAEEWGHHTFEAKHVRKDGTIFPVAIDVTAVKDESGNVLYRIASVQDISERKQAEERIQRQLQRLATLRMIDLVITASLDQRVTFNVLLEQILNQLGVDAAALLLLNPVTLQLEHAASRGFRTHLIQQSSLQLGQGLAGRVGLEQRIISVSDFTQVKDGFLRRELLEAEELQAYQGIPLITKGQVKGVLELYYRRPFVQDTEWKDFMEALAGQAAVSIDNLSLYENLQQSSLELTRAYDATLQGWSKALELRDYETQGHSQRVTDLTLRLARRMGLSEDELVQVRRGTLLHDIGKMGVPDSILLKPGGLTDEEWEIMRRHPVYAYNLIDSIPYLRSAIDIPYCHHEKWDGSGYPRGLKGEQIPFAARLFAVVDVWDALLSDRPYRTGWSSHKVKRYIRENSGTHFDPAITAAFLKMMAE